MKKEDLVEVIQALDQVEGTSVTFQSVWNNPRSHEWVFHLKRSVQVSVLLIVFIGVFVPLTYSFINQSSESTSLAENKIDAIDREIQMRNEEQYAAGVIHPNETIRAYIHGLPNHVVIRGISSLPVGTNIVIEIWTEDQGRLVGEHTVKTELDGHFTVQIERENRSEDYLVSLKLMPHQQPKEVLSVIGQHGEKLEQSDKYGLYSYEKDHQEYFGIHLYNRIHGIKDTNVSQNTRFFDYLVSN